MFGFRFLKLMNSGFKFWTNQAAFQANENLTEQLANFLVQSLLKSREKLRGRIKKSNRFIIDFKG